MGAVDDVSATGHRPIQQPWLAMSGLTSQPLADNRDRPRARSRPVYSTPELLADRAVSPSRVLSGYFTTNLAEIDQPAPDVSCIVTL